MTRRAKPPVDIWIPACQHDVISGWGDYAETERTVERYCEDRRTHGKCEKDCAGILLYRRVEKGE